VTSTGQIVAGTVWRRAALALRNTFAAGDDKKPVINLRLTDCKVNESA